MTMCRDLYWYDSAELALAAVQPGLSHPPGQPLHTLLGWAMKHFVPGHPLFGVNLVSALCAALTALPAWSIARRLDPRTPGRGAWISAAVLVGLGLNDAVWETATRVEVYAPAALLALTQLDHLMGAMERLREGPQFHHQLPWRWFDRFRDSDWLIQGLLLGLTFSLHPYIAVFMSVVSLVASATTLLTTRRERPLRSALLLLLGGLLGLLPYLWIPVSTAFPQHLVWGDPDTFSRLLFYLQGQDYAHNRATIGGTLDHVLHFLGWLAIRGHLPILLGGALAWWLGTGRGAHRWVRTAPLILMAMGILVIGRIGNYRPEIPDFMGYLLPATWLAGAGLAAISSRAYLGSRTRSIRILVAGLISIWVAMNALVPPSVVDRSRGDNHLARSLAQEVLTDAPEDAIILVSSDHMLFPLLYLTEQEHLRQDVVVINHGWASSSWYWEFLCRRYPDLGPVDPTAPTRNERIRRWLADHPDRPVLAENLALASLAEGRRIVRWGWMLRADPVTRAVDPAVGVTRHAWARHRLSHWLTRHGTRGTQDRKILSFIATQWGHDERRGGLPGHAVLDYLAGASTPPGARMDLPADLMDPRGWNDPLPPPPASHPFRLLSSPELNLFHAGALLTHHRHGMDTGMEIIGMAASAGCVEARTWLMRKKTR